MKKLQLLWVYQSYMEPDTGAKLHSHDYCHLICVQEGELCFTLEDVEFLLGAGDLVLVPKGACHKFRNGSSRKTAYYEIKFIVLNRTLEQMLAESDHRICGDSFACRLVEHIADEYLYNRTLNDDSASVALRTLVYHLTSQKRMIREGQPPIIDTGDYGPLSQKVIDYLTVHFSENLTLDHISSAVEISKNYLCNAFKRDTGMTILDCLNMIRVRKAAELIVYSDLSLAQVAQRCGYVSTSHFNRVFSRIAGIPPGQCRRAFSFDHLVTHTDRAKRNPDTFMYSVLAGKSISPRTINEFELNTETEE